MKKQLSDQQSKKVLIIFFLIILGISGLMVLPFLSAILAGMVLAYLSYPLYVSLHNRLKRPKLSALIVCIGILFIIVLPLLFIIGALAHQAIGVFSTLRQENILLDFNGNVCISQNNALCITLQKYLSMIPQTTANDYLHQIISQSVTFGLRLFSNVITGLPSVILGLFIALFCTYYFLKDGQKIYRYIRHMIPIEERYKKIMENRFNEVTYAVFFGTIAVAALQGFVGGIGFYILGIPNPLLWGVLMWLLALIPLVGTAIVWFPWAASLMISGYVHNETAVLIRGIILLLYGALVISTMDNLVRPKIIGDRGNVHPLIVLLGILGGLRVFGLAGFILGPAILSVLIVFIKIYRVTSVR